MQKILKLINLDVGWRKEIEAKPGRILRPSNSSFAVSYQRSLLRVVAFHKSAVGFIGSTPMTTHGGYASLRFALRKRRFYAFHNKEEEKGESGMWMKRDRESGFVRNVQAKRASENRRIATSVINGILSSLHVKLGWTSPCYLFIPCPPPHAFLLGFITQLIRQMHDRYRAHQARGNCYRRLITLQISYLNPTPFPFRCSLLCSGSVSTLVRVERTRLSCLFGQCDGRIVLLRIDERYPESIIGMHAEDVPLSVENIL